MHYISSSGRDMIINEQNNLCLVCFGTNIIFFFFSSPYKLSPRSRTIIQVDFKANSIYISITCLISSVVKFAMKLLKDFTLRIIKFMLKDFFKSSPLSHCNRRQKPTHLFCSTHGHYHLQSSWTHLSAYQADGRTS